jgi:hypothetical protein
MLYLPCHIWTGDHLAAGYGRITMLDPETGRRRQYRVSHLMVTEWYGVVPDLVMHLCDTPACWEPSHLRSATDAQNTADMIAKGRYRNGQSLKTHCPAGHPYDELNTRLTRTGGRACRACARARQHNRTHRTSLNQALTPSYSLGNRPCDLIVGGNERNTQ